MNLSETSSNGIPILGQDGKEFGRVTLKQDENGMIVVDKFTPTEGVK